MSGFAMLIESSHSLYVFHATLLEGTEIPLPLQKDRILFLL